jgi:hypothetical protein
LKIVDPSRIRHKEKGPQQINSNNKTQLDIVLTGVGSTEISVFTQAIDFENIDAPTSIVGDVAYIPVDKQGKPLRLTRK